MKLLVLSKHDCKMYEKKEIKYLSGQQETRHGRRSSDTLTTQQHNTQSELKILNGYDKCCTNGGVVSYL